MQVGDLVRFKTDDQIVAYITGFDNDGDLMLTLLQGYGMWNGTTLLNDYKSKWESCNADR